MTPDLAETAADFVSQIEERRGSRRRAREGRASERRRPRFWTAFLALVAVLAVLVSLLPYLVGRSSGTAIELPPEELLGTWTTDDPRYADRSITINEQELLLDLGPNGRYVYPIRSIDAEVAEVHRHYTVSYRDEGGEQSMDLFVYDDGLLRLANPSEVRWQREPD